MKWLRRQEDGIWVEGDDAPAIILEERPKLLGRIGENDVTEDFSRVVKDRDFSRKVFGQGTKNAVSFRKCRFSFCIFNDNVLSCSQFDECEFQNCECRAKLINGAGCLTEMFAFIRCKFIDVRFSRDINGACFSGCHLRKVQFDGLVENALVEDTEMVSCNFRDTKFLHCSFQNVNMSQSLLSSATRFDSCVMTVKLKLHRTQLSYLNQVDMGGLTPGQLSDMTIKDDFRDLRLVFGGFWRVLHWIGIISFLSPYIIFSALRLTEAFLDQSPFWIRIQQLPIESTLEPNSIVFWQTLWNFFVTGGQSWQEISVINYMSIISFTVFGVYNVARAVLVWKSMQLEAVEHVTNLPPVFDLDSPDYRYDNNFVQRFLTYNVSFAWVAFKYLSWAAAVAAVAHTVNFLMIPIPTR